jgi:hypothetical protein
MPETRLSLSTMIQEFRRELAEAQAKGQHQHPRLIADHPHLSPSAWADEGAGVCGMERG